MALPADPVPDADARVAGSALAADSPYRVVDGTRVDLSAWNPGETEGYTSKDEARPELEALRDRMRELQGRLYAEQRQSLLVVLQAMDTGGKDGTIKDVFRGVNPQGCRVASFRVPSEEERSHDFLWRYHRRTPPRGMITIFNRSHYEDVLVVRVKGLVPEEVWRPRYEAIRDFEASLAREGVIVLKFFLNISKDEQRRRLQKRLDNPAKHWKFSKGDLVERARWDDYQRAYEDALSETSTREAPWYVVPADRKWFRNVVVARAIVGTLEAMDPQFPAPEPGLEAIRIV